MYNPKVKDFLKDNEHITVIGLYWAGYWRLALIVGGIYLGIMILALAGGSL